MTPADRDLISALARCTFPPGSAEKRFVRDIYKLATVEHNVGITEKQAAYLRILAWRYRRQMPAALVPKEKPTDIATRLTRRTA